MRRSRAGASGETNIDKNPEIAIESKSKLEFYFLALVFTVLALAIQTGHLQKEYYPFIFEMSAWVSLLASGLAGLSRLEWIPGIHQHLSAIEHEQELADALGVSNRPLVWQDTGQVVSPEERRTGKEAFPKRST